eukprot:gene7846-5474_t
MSATVTALERFTGAAEATKELAYLTDEMRKRAQPGNYSLLTHAVLRGPMSAVRAMLRSPRDIDFTATSGELEQTPVASCVVCVGWDFRGVFQLERCRPHPSRALGARRPPPSPSNLRPQQQIRRCERTEPPAPRHAGLPATDAVPQRHEPAALSLRDSPRAAQKSTRTGTTYIATTAPPLSSALNYLSMKRDAIDLLQAQNLHHLPLESHSRACVNGTSQQKNASLSSPRIPFIFLTDEMRKSSWVLTEEQMPVVASCVERGADVMRAAGAQPGNYSLLTHAVLRGPMSAVRAMLRSPRDIDFTATSGELEQTPATKGWHYTISQRCIPAGALPPSPEQGPRRSSSPSNLRPQQQIRRCERTEPPAPRHAGLPATDAVPQRHEPAALSLRDSPRAAQKSTRTGTTYIATTALSSALNYLSMKRDAIDFLQAQNLHHLPLESHSRACVNSTSQQKNASLSSPRIPFIF